ncbi:MAG: glycosyltransferase [Proteobacteria bacterium]|nr:glycosyltransferase [Pseudomonadota bacterium]
MRIAFLTRSLTAGGAERQLGVLARALAKKGHDVSIFTFYAPVGDSHDWPRVRIISLGKAGRWHVMTFFWRLIVAMRRQRPDIIHSYLPTANCIAALIRPFVPGAKLVFGVRSSDMQPAAYDRLERLIYWLEARLALKADLMIANSHAAKHHLIERGTPAEKLAVIPNGIDSSEFKLDRARGETLRTEWLIAPDETVIGLAARFDPMKDHGTFFDAFALLRPDANRLRAVLVGGGSAELRRKLQDQALALGIADRIVWAGPHADMAAVYSAFDLLCLPSAYGEGFPNVVAEAMACEVPCLVTDVGDAAAIVGDLGEIVPPRNAAALAAGLRSILARPADERRRLGEAARQKIVENYSIARLTDATLDVIEKIAR